MYKSLHFSVLCAFLHLIPSTQADSSMFPGKVEPYNYMWYDATEECKTTTLPCFTNFKHCSKSNDTDDDAKCPDSVQPYDGLDWGTDWMEYQGKPLPMFGSTGIILKWMNTNPQYPTHISWNFDADYGNHFSMYKVIPPGETQWSFILDYLPDRMFPSQFVAANKSMRTTGGDEYKLVAQLANSASRASPAFFSIGQPDDPKYGKFHNENLQGKTVNATDRTSRFTSKMAWGRQITDEQWAFREYLQHQSEQIKKKWQLGVGIAVGLGFPLFMALAFFLGRKSASRSASKASNTKQGDAKEWDNRGLCKP